MERLASLRAVSTEDEAEESDEMESLLDEEIDLELDEWDDDGGLGDETDEDEATAGARMLEEANRLLVRAKNRLAEGGADQAKAERLVRLLENTVAEANDGKYEALADMLEEAYDLLIELEL